MLGPRGRQTLGGDGMHRRRMRSGADGEPCERQQDPADKSAAWAEPTTPNVGFTGEPKLGEC